MTANKNFKRLVRARMSKTGESYTSARSHLVLAPSIKPKPAPEAKPDYATLAGMSDEAVKNATGCPWERWVKALDHKKADTWSHNELATYIHEKYKIDGWWAQMTAVGYERIKGLRSRGQRRGGTWDATKSKTINAPVAVVFKAFKDTRTRNRWLPGLKTVVRTSQANKSVRLGMPDGTIAGIWFTAKDAAKTSIGLGQDNLPSKAVADDKKAFWADRLNALAAMLATSAARRTA